MTPKMEQPRQSGGKNEREREKEKIKNGSSDWKRSPQDRWKKSISNISSKLLRKDKKLIRTSEICDVASHILVQSDTKNRELLKNPTKIEEIQEKKFIDRNWTIKTCLLRDSNPNCQCLKITSCRWRPPPRMRQSCILQSVQHTQGDTKERELLKCVVAVKECIRGGGRHLTYLLHGAESFLRS